MKLTDFTLAPGFVFRNGGEETYVVPESSLEGIPEAGAHAAFLGVVDDEEPEAVAVFIYPGGQEHYDCCIGQLDRVRAYYDSHDVVCPFTWPSP